MSKQKFANGPWAYPVDTSMEAADHIEPRAPLLRDRVLASVEAAGRDGATVVETANREGLDRMSIQPRFTELYLAGKITDSKRRRKNPSGVNAIVWIVPEYVEASNG